MKNKWSLIALLLGGATVLGATVLRVPIARAAQAVSAAITSPLDANGNVAVHEQGTANVNVVNTPTVTFGDTETVLLFDGDVASGIPGVHVDVAKFQDVRVLAALTAGLTTCPFQVNTLSPQGYEVPMGVLTMTNGGASEAFQIPGRTLDVVAGANGCAAHVTVYGRTR